MSWLTVSGRDLLPADQGQAIAKLLDLIEQNVNDDGDDLVAIVRTLIDGGDVVDEGARLLGERFLDDDQQAALAQLRLLRKPLKDLEQKDDASDRTVGWPKLSWSRTEDLQDFEFALNAKGDVSFVVAHDEKPDDGDQIALTDLTLAGSIEGKAARAISHLKGRLKVDLSGGISFGHEYPVGTPAWRALAGAMICAAHPIDDFDDVLAAFNGDNNAAVGVPSDTLQLIELKRGSGFEVGLEGSIKVPMKGVFEGKLSALSSIGKNTTLTVKQASTAADRLQIEVHSELGSKTEIDVGLGYTIGLSSIAPEFARELLDRIAGSKAFIDKIDGRISEVEDQVSKAKSWLKPGTVIREHLTSLIDARLADDPNGEFLGYLASLAGLSKDKDLDKIKTFVAEELANALDEARDLFGSEVEESAALRKIRDDFAGEIQSFVGEQFETLLTAAQEKLTSLLDDAVNDLDDAAATALKDLTGDLPDDPLAQAKAALKEARRLLDDAAKGLNKAMDDAFSINIAWAYSKTGKSNQHVVAEIAADGAGFYRQLVRHPRTVIGTLSGKPGEVQPGVKITKALFSGELIEQRSLGIKLGLLGLKSSDTTTMLAKAQITPVQGGIAVVTKGEIERTISFFGETRQCSFMNVLSFGATKEESVPRLEVSLTREDDGLSGDEVDDFKDAFLNLGLITKDAGAALKTAYDALAKAQKGNAKIAADLSIGIALPADETYEVIAKAPGLTDPDLETIAATALGRSEIIKSRIDNMLHWVRYSSDSSVLKSLDNKGVQVTTSRSGKVSAYHVYDYIALILNCDPLVPALKSAVGHGRGRSATAHRHFSLMEQLSESRKGFATAFRLMNEARTYVADVGAGANPSPAQIDAHQVQLVAWQKEINAAIRPWVNPQNRTIAIGRTPAAALIWACAEVVRRTTGDSPPLLIGLKPEKGRQRQFLGAAPTGA